jgi:hypothetical protein
MSGMNVVMWQIAGCASKHTAARKMAYPPSYHPIKNLTQFRSGNWTWAPPGARGNVCDNCGTHCFCDAKKGLLPRKRRAVVDVVDAAPPAAAEAAPAVVDDATPPAAADAAPAVLENVEFEGILALSAYDE